MQTEMPDVDFGDSGDDWKALVASTKIWLFVSNKGMAVAAGGLYFPSLLTNDVYLWIKKLRTPERSELLSLIKFGRLFIKSLPWYAKAEVSINHLQGKRLVESLGMVQLGKTDERLIYGVK